LKGRVAVADARSWPRRRAGGQRTAGVAPRPNTPSRALAPPPAVVANGMGYPCVGTIAPRSRVAHCPAHSKGASAVPIDARILTIGQVLGRPIASSSRARGQRQRPAQET
jgi:hypothetical protein